LNLTKLNTELTMKQPVISTERRNLVSKAEKNALQTKTDFSLNARNDSIEKKLNKI